MGGGGRIVYEDVTRAGGDPESEGSDFDALYQPDGSHPSVRGAYLASCIVAGSITGIDARRFADEPTLSPEVSARLPDVCGRTLVDPRWHVPTIMRPDAVLEGDGATGGNVGWSVDIDADGGRVLVGSAYFGRATPASRAARSAGKEHAARHDEARERMPARRAPHPERACMDREHR